MLSENKKFYFAPNPCEIRKILRNKHCSFQKDLQIRFELFFHKSCIFSFLHQKRFYDNEKFNFLAKI